MRWPSCILPERLMLRSIRGIGVPTRLLVGAVIVSVVLGSCTRPEPETRDGGPPTTSPPTETVSPDDTSSGPGAPAGDCVNGYDTPAPGSPLYRRPLEVIAGTAGVEGEFEVEEIRYFEGPEAPPSEMGYLAVVKRWYVKARLVDRPGWKGRFLVEEREFGIGLAAVAPWDSRGFRSPDWRGFQWEGVDSQPARYEGLPGRWPGTIYDFVRGGAGIDIAGLPREVIGCLSGT
jgi:hypothetical protein